MNEEMCVQSVCCDVNMRYIHASGSVKSRSPNRQGQDEGWEGTFLKYDTSLSLCDQVIPPWHGSFLKFDLHKSMCLYRAGVFPPTFADVIYGGKHIHHLD